MDTKKQRPGGPFGQPRAGVLPEDPSRVSEGGRGDPNWAFGPGTGVCELARWDPCQLENRS